MVTSDDLYSQILDSGPSPGTLFHVLTKLKEAGQSKRVIEEAVRALKVYPKEIQIRKLLAETYFEVGLIQQAEVELEKVTTHVTDLISVYKLKAEVYSKQNRHKQAQDALKLYLTHRPDDKEAVSSLDAMGPVDTATEGAADPVEKAASEGLTASERDELSEIATPTLAEIYFNQGQIEEALKTYEIVVSRNPEDEHSQKRYEELKTMFQEERAAGEAGKRERENLRREKLISILDSWLLDIRERFRVSPAA